MKKLRELMEDLEALKKEARSFLDEGKVEEARAKTDEAKLLREKIDLLKELEDKEDRDIKDKIDESRAKDNKPTQSIEERGRAIKENRAVKVDTGDLVLPKHSATHINPTFNDVSSLIDRVKHTKLQGGESYEVPYIVSYGEEGEYTEEGEDYHEVEPEFNYAPINKTKVTVYTETTEEVEKLPAADYYNTITGVMSSRLRLKLTRDILIGDGEAGHLVGIFSDKAKAIDPKTDKEISKIDEYTLDDIVFSFGGDEEVEDVAVLVLNKDDLREFAMLRHKDGQKVYDVKIQGNTGTINTVPFIINSACKSITNGEVGDYCMAYGPLSNYELATFAPVEVMKSIDFKFKQGMVAHRGSGFMGGNVVAHNGFLRIKKGGEAQTKKAAQQKETETDKK